MEFYFQGLLLPKNDLLGAIRFVLDKFFSTFFSFDNKIYKQNFGIPVDSPLITYNCGPSNDEIRDGILDVVKSGHFILL